MRKTLNKLSGIFLAIILCLSMAVPTQAAGKRAKMMTAYRNFMEKRTSYYDQFALIYYNNDSTPDLLYNNYVDTAVYTYKKASLYVYIKILPLVFILPIIQRKKC